jgi:hypothetical protein
VFSMWSAPRNSMGAAFSAWSVMKVYKRQGKSLGALEIRSSNGTVVWPEVVEGIRLCQEHFVCDFICAVVLCSLDGEI